MNECETRGYSYNWCNRLNGSSTSWGKCSPDEGLDIYGNNCSTPCLPYHDWSEETTFGQALGEYLKDFYSFKFDEAVSNILSYKKESYHWCYVGNTWQTCSITNITKYKEVALMKFQTIYGNPCLGECKKLFGKPYGQCMAPRQLQYCSPEEGKDYYGEECETPCSRKENQKYFTCKSKSNDNQYCSVKLKEW